MIQTQVISIYSKNIRRRAIIFQQYLIMENNTFEACDEASNKTIQLNTRTQV